MNYIDVSNFPKEKIYILLNRNFRRNLIEKSMQKLNCKNYFELALWINKTSKTKFNGGDIKYWIKGRKLDKRTNKVHQKFMPLWLVFKLAKLNMEQMRNLNKEVISYRAWGKGLVINNPTLPIKVTPELDSIVIHLFGDGAAGNFTPSYTQKNKDSFDNFIKKLENCFGKFQKSIYFTQGKYQIKFPKAITDIISHYYSIKSYKSRDSSIPKSILNRKNKKHKLACIISFILDEGQIRDTILLYNANKDILSQIRQLVIDCNYRCSEIKFNKKAKSYSFSISNKNIKKFYQDIKKLSKEFPTCNLSFKEKDLAFIIKRRDKKNPKNSKITDQVILNVLKKGRFTSKEISRLTKYAHCTITHHLAKLYEKKMIKRTKTQNKSCLWELY